MYNYSKKYEPARIHLPQLKENITAITAITKEKVLGNMYVKDSNIASNVVAFILRLLHEYPDIK